MAEVVATFAAISSFLQIIDFTTKFAKNLKIILEEKGEAADLAQRTLALAREYQNAVKSVPITLQNDQRSKEEDDVLRQQNELSAQSSKLIQKLERLQIDATSSLSKAKRIRESTKRAWRAATEANEVDEARLHLQELNDLLGTSLMRLLLSRHEAQVETAIALRQELQGMKDEEKICQLNARLLGMHNYILTNLGFADMHRRHDMIEDNYQDTYQWAVENDYLGLKSWLRSGSGIFWINGKAGSGKSTLMKYLSSCKQTHNLLRTWAHPEMDVTQASFFFWFRGSALQRSLIGLLRSIMYQLLRHSSPLAIAAFPNLYAAIVPPHGQTTWSFAELLTAFQAVLRSEDNGTRQKVCLFIDGLDEYSGHQLELVQLVRSLAEHSHVKLCVSSRPWNVFRKAFDHKVPTIRLEDLTYHDIKQYVSGEVRSCLASTSSLLEAGGSYTSEISTSPVGTPPSPEDPVARLIEEIVRKAEGVFLWVILVVKSVLRGIEQSDPIHMLEARVREFPPDLGEFFQYIIERVDSVYKKQTSQALKLACSLTENEDAKALSSWIDYWLISQYQSGLLDDRFAYDLEPQEISHHINFMYSQTQSFISASCKDLLWLPTTVDLTTASNPWIQVEFLHRTVYEYLSNPAHGFKALVNDEVPAMFQDDRVLHSLNLARINFWTKAEERDSRRKMMKQFTGMALHRPWTELRVQYVEGVEKIIYFHASSYHPPSKVYDTAERDTYLLDFIPRWAIGIFIAFKRYRFVQDLVQEYRDRVHDDDLDLDDLDNPFPGLLSATMGLSIYGKFELDDIHAPLAHAVFKLWDVFDEEHGPLDYLSIWDAFLRRWAKSAATIDVEHAWDIAKLFLHRGASVHWTIDDPSHSTGSSPHPSRVEAKEFLEKHIPQFWVPSSHVKCFAGDCVHTSRPADNQAIRERQTFMRKRTR